MPDCSLCGKKLKLKYTKKKGNATYCIFDCVSCRLWQLSPIPSHKELSALYADDYFKTRTDRGYNNYLSSQVGESILNTIKKNLNQLKFTDIFITSQIGILKSKKSNITSKDDVDCASKFGRRPEPMASKVSLDVGCASGYFVEYMKQQGWQSEGIDIAPTMVAAAKQKGLEVREGDFLKTSYKKENYDLITLWASIEHLPSPKDFIKKFYDLLKPGGHVYISTCHLGFWARIWKQNWRFLNVPEHIWFFSRKSLQKYFEEHSFHLNQAFTYGSGFTAKKESLFFYSIFKKIADFTAKYCFLGDMIVCDFVKRKDLSKSSLNK